MVNGQELYTCNFTYVRQFTRRAFSLFVRIAARYNAPLFGLRTKNL